MNTRSMRTLIIIAVILVVAVVALDIASDRYRTTDGEELLPGFGERINDVTEVVVRYPDATATIARAGSGWLVREKDGYRADTGTLRQVLIALKDATKLEQKTANPELHDRLGLSTADDGKGVELTISGDGFEHALVIGDVAQQSYRYVRFADADQSWLIDQNPEIPDDDGGWLAPDILDLPSSRVRSVRIVHADGERIAFSKSSAEDSSYAVADIPEGRELSYPGVVNGIAGALSNLELEDVRRRPDELPEPQATTTWTTFEGLEVVASRYAVDDETWIAFAAGDVGPAEEEQASGDDETATDTDSKAGDAAAPSDGEAAGEAPSADGTVPVAEQAGNISETAAAWLYRLPDHKARLMARRWSDLLKAPADSN